MTTSGQSILAKDRIAATNGRFNSIRQVAPMCPHGRAHWHHLANTVELVLPSAQPIHYASDKLIDSTIFAQLTQ